MRNSTRQPLPTWLVTRQVPPSSFMRLDMFPKPVAARLGGSHVKTPAVVLDGDDQVVSLVSDFQEQPRWPPNT